MLTVIFTLIILAITGRPVDWYHVRLWSEGLRFKSRAGQTWHSVANSSPPLQHFFKGAVLLGRNDAEIGPANLLHASAKHCQYNENWFIWYQQQVC